MNITPRRVLLLVLFIGVLVGCDQTTKTIARSSLEDSTPVSLLSDVIRFEYAENHGAFLSLGATLPAWVRAIVFIGFVSVALVAAFWVAVRTNSDQRLQTWGLALITAGGFGNLIDRLQNNGAVVDFVSINLLGFRTGVFNLADVAVTAGFLALVIHTFQQVRSSQDDEPDHSA